MTPQREHLPPIRSMTIENMIHDMQTRGWTVTFPAFGNTRAMLVKATKGDESWQRGWQPGNNSFQGAVERLHGTTQEHLP